MTKSAEKLNRNNKPPSFHYDPDNPDLIKRWLPLSEFLAMQNAGCLDPFHNSFTSPLGPRVALLDQHGIVSDKLNFATQDSLSLTRHPSVLGAASMALESCGVHACDTVGVVGKSALVRELETRMSRFPQLSDTAVFATGTVALFSAIRALAGHRDHIILNRLAAAHLCEASHSVTSNVHLAPHLTVENVADKVDGIRLEARGAGILVVTETVTELDGDIPDLSALQQYCRETVATLLVDVSGDLGCLGPGGTGALGAQGVLGDIDVVTGGFDRTFASGLGFVATNHVELRTGMRCAGGALFRSQSISSIEAACALAAIDVVDSADGDNRRRLLAANVQRLAEGLGQIGYAEPRQSGPSVSVVLGHQKTARRALRMMQESGALIGLAEFPAVPQNACRWLVRVMAGHNPDDITEFLAIAAGVRAAISDF